MGIVSPLAHRIGWRRVLHWPVATFLLAGLALFVAGDEQLATALQLDRSALARGELWRTFSGHLVHFGRQHLILDCAVLIGLGMVCERWAPRRTRLTLALAAPVIALAVLVFDPTIAVYRGLSGLDSTLFALLAALVWRESRSGGGGVWTWLVLAAAVGFALKVGFELTSGRSAFADGRGLFRSVPVAHVAGAAVGLLGGALGGVPGFRIEGTRVHHGEVVARK